MKRKKAIRFVASFILVSAFSVLSFQYFFQTKTWTGVKNVIELANTYNDVNNVPAKNLNLLQDNKVAQIGLPTHMFFGLVRIKNVHTDMLRKRIYLNIKNAILQRQLLDQLRGTEEPLPNIISAPERK